jgi:hypothetical protein
LWLIAIKLWRARAKNIKKHRNGFFVAGGEWRKQMWKNKSTFDSWNRVVYDVFGAENACTCGGRQSVFLIFSFSYHIKILKY